MNIKLSRPLACFDLETTGISVATDRIVEISILKVHPNGNKDSLTRRVNPTIPILLEASEIHGIYDIDVANEPTFKELAPSIIEFLDNCDLSGFNCNRFDIPLFMEEVLRTGFEFDIETRKVVDVQTIFHKKEKRTLEAAYQFYCNKTLENAHSAEADAAATFEVLDAQIEKYEDLPKDILNLSEFSAHNKNVDLMGRIIENNKGVAVFNFGKHKGKAVEYILQNEPGYYGWMMNGDFPLYTKKVLTDIKQNLG
ncbi:MAG: 3'-5' exonuclease [Flavobacteriales bacterium]|nr:3'-5' exonuclease [Flavobacteriales bacterium]